MSVISCFEPNCVREIEVSCSCTSPPTFSCKEHLFQHCQSTIVNHNLTSLFIKPVEDTKEAILKFFVEQKLKNDAIKKEILTSFSQTIHNLEKTFKSILEEIDSDSTKFASHFDKIWQAEKVSRLVKDPILSLLLLQSQEAIEKVKAIFSVHNSFESLNNMRDLIDQLVSSFLKEREILISYKKLLTIEIADVKSEKEAKNTQQVLNEDIKIIKIYPKNSVECNSIGNIFYDEMKYEETVKYYSDAIRINPNNALYYSNKGNALSYLGRREEATECYQQAIRIDPNNDDAYNGIGNILKDEERYEEALKYYNSAIRINPNRAIYYKNKEIAHKGLNNRSAK